jgi:hypothetical protein
VGEGSLPSFDPTTAAEPRVYNYLIGGKDNFEVDRRVADALVSKKRVIGRWQYPAVENRRFMERAVRYLMDAGVRQFIDIGCGFPTEKDNVHQIAHEIDPTTRVVYVDWDPNVHIHFRTMLQGVPHTAALQADARRPKEIITHPDVAGLIDFARPVAVLLIALLHHIPDEDDPEGVVAFLRDAVPAGSYLVISHMTSDGPPPSAVRRFERVFDNVRESMTMRPRDRIRGFFGDMELVEPGLVDGGDWHPDEDETPPSNWLAVGVAKKV